MATLELCTLHASIGALWWYHITIFVLLELPCVHYRTSHSDGENLTFISQFRRFTKHYKFHTFYLIFIGCSSFLLFCIINSCSYICLLLRQDNPSDKDLNQGTLVVFNLDPSVSNEDLRQIFGAYGEVKEVPNFSPLVLNIALHQEVLCHCIFDIGNMMFMQ